MGRRFHVAVNCAQPFWFCASERMCRMLACNRSSRREIARRAVAPPCHIHPGSGNPQHFTEGACKAFSVTAEVTRPREKSGDDSKQ